MRDHSTWDGLCQMHPFFIASFIVYYIAWLLFFSPTVRVLRIWTQRSIPPKLELTRLTLITTGVPLARFLLFFFFPKFLSRFSRVRLLALVPFYVVSGQYIASTTALQPLISACSGFAAVEFAAPLSLSLSPGPLSISFSISIILPSFPTLRSTLLIHPLFSYFLFFILFYYPYNLFNSPLIILPIDWQVSSKVLISPVPHPEPVIQKLSY